MLASVIPTSRRSTPSRARLGALGVVLALLVGLVVPSGASALSKGLMDEELARSDDQTLRDAFWAVGQSANVKFVRTFVNWDGRYAFPFPHEIDRVKRVAVEGAAHGVDTLFVSFNGELGKHYKDAAKVPLKRYRAMVRKSVEQLRGVPLRIIWSPWNEANYQTQLPKKHGAETWRKMQNIAYDEIKKIDPKALVVAGELAPYARSLKKSSNPGPFLREALGLDKNWKARKGTRAKDYKIKADAITLHSYDYKNNPRKRLSSKDQWTIRNLATQRTLLKRAARTKRVSGTAIKRLYITEFAYIFRESSQTISDTVAATWLQSAWDIAKKNGVRGLLWFNVRDPEKIFFSGLVGPDNQPRAVLPVFQQLQ